jgi:hypothetical protein
LRIANCILRIAYCELHIANCTLRIADCELHIVNCTLLNQHGGFEAFYILEGEGALEIGDERVVLNSGEGIVFDPQKLHGHVNTGSLPLQYTVIPTAQEDDPAG